MPAGRDRVFEGHSQKERGMTLAGHDNVGPGSDGDRVGWRGGSGGAEADLDGGDGRRAAGVGVASKEGRREENALSPGGRDGFGHIGLVVANVDPGERLGVCEEEAGPIRRESGSGDRVCEGAEGPDQLARKEVEDGDVTLAAPECGICPIG
jgi:hypothetical protein